MESLELIKVIGIPLDKYFNRIGLIDEADWELVSSYKWEAHKDKKIIYVRSSRKNGKRIFIHNLIMPFREGFTVDHKDGNGLNNIRENLRYATFKQQAYNTARNRQFKGTSQTPDGKWMAQIMIDGKNNYLGRYVTREEAAQAYSIAANKYFGEFKVERLLQ